VSSPGSHPRSLSVAIITYNEEERLPACLASIQDLADEVVVVDSGSTDRTQQIARQYGARMIDHPWEGFGRQKQFAVDQCRYRWVLILDADERLTPEAVDEIRAVLAAPAFSAYSLPRKNLFCGRWLRHAGWWPDRVVRLFDKKRAQLTDRLVHEAVEASGPVGTIAAPIVHLANRDLSHTIDKINRYSTAGARQLAAAGRRANLLTATGRALWAFVGDYLLRRGFLDGAPGFLQAVCNAVNVFFKYAKLWELHRRRDGDGRAGEDSHCQDQRHR